MESKPDWGNDSERDLDSWPHCSHKTAFKTAKNLTASRLLSSESKWKRFDVS